MKGEREYGLIIRATASSDVLKDIEKAAVYALARSPMFNKLVDIKVVRIEADAVVDEEPNNNDKLVNELINSRTYLKKRRKP